MKKYFISTALDLFTIASQIIWYNEHILVDKRSFYNTILADKGINHVGQIFNTDGAMKPWSVFKSGFSLHKNSHFYWIQLKPFRKLRKKIFIKETEVFMSHL